MEDFVTRNGKQIKKMEMLVFDDTSDLFKITVYDFLYYFLHLIDIYSTSFLPIHSWDIEQITFLLSLNLMEDSKIDFYYLFEF